MGVMHLSVTVRCGACHSEHEVPMTGVPVPSEPGVLQISTARDDEAWAHLFVRSHRGPFAAVN